MDTPTPGPESKDQPGPNAAGQPSGPRLAVAIFALLALMLVLGRFAAPGLNLILVTVLMLLSFVIVGKSITHRPLGVLVNQRNLMSLSRFQMTVWTVVVLSAYFTFALTRIKVGAPDPLAVQMDWHLWALLGISATSLVGTPLILSTKQDKEPDPAVIERTAQLIHEPKEDIDANREGTLYVNPSITDACFTDMFEGDEVNNTAHVDLAKVQMFYFTIIAAVAFFVMVFHALTQANPDLDRLPMLPDGLVAILGISNAGYLTSKGIDHTKLKS